MAARDVVRRLEHGALDIRRRLLKLCTQQLMHIGGDLSAADIMTALWKYGMNYDPEDPKRETRDRFILSKGHAAAVTSYCQAAIGCYDPEDINREYATDNGRFAMHSCNLINPHVEVSTGSLGHGLPVGGGMAAALKLKGNAISRVYVLMGDGEQSEGSIWEAVRSAAETGRLIAAQDHNLIGGLGFYVGAVLAEERLSPRFRMLGAPDHFVPIATASYLFKKNGYDMEGLVKNMKEMLKSY